MAGRTPRVSGVTERRPGVYAFLDLEQVSLGPWSLDQCALTVLAAIVSHARPCNHVVDAGFRSIAGGNDEWGRAAGSSTTRTTSGIRAAEEHWTVLVPDDVTGEGMGDGWSVIGRGPAR